MSEATIVTSENLAEFNAARMGLLDAGKPTPKEEAKEEPGEVVAEAKEVEEEPEVVEEAKPVKKPPATVPYERLSEATKKRQEAEERATAAERERDELKAKLAPPEPVKADPSEPKPEDFPDAFQFAAALAEFKVGKALEARDKADAEKVQKAAAAKVVSAWQERVNAVKAEVPDFDEKLAASEVAVSDPVRDALIESEHGPRILLELAENPEIAEKLKGMSFGRQLIEIGKLEARFDKPEKPEPEGKPAVIVRPKAPAPITPVKGAKSADVPVDENGEYTGSYAQFKKDMAAGRLK